MSMTFIYHVCGGKGDFLALSPSTSRLGICPLLLRLILNQSKLQGFLQCLLCSNDVTLLNVRFCVIPIKQFSEHNYLIFLDLRVDEME